MVEEILLHAVCVSFINLPKPMPPFLPIQKSPSRPLPHEGQLDVLRTLVPQMIDGDEGLSVFDLAGRGVFEQLLDCRMLLERLVSS